MPIPILIDDREQPSGLSAALRRLGRVPELRRLPLGDIAVGDSFLIERKEAADLAASLADGRLDAQAARLAAHRAKHRIEAVLIVEGKLDQASLPGIELEPIRQAILAIQLDRAIPVLRAASIDETAAWIVALARRAESGLSLARPFSSRAASPPVRPRRAKPLRSPADLQLAALARVPGLGPAKARALLDRFGSVSALQAATEADWLSVPGIGPELARALDAFFGKKRA